MKAAIVSIRSTSSRRPRKCFAKIAPQLSMTQVILRRASKMNPDLVILATSDDPSDDELVEHVNSEDVEVFRGALKNKIKRWHDCFNHFKIDQAIMVDGDDPTFDYEVGRRGLNQLSQTDADMVSSCTTMIPGLFTHGFHKNGIEKLLKFAPTRDIDTDVITKFVEAAKLNRHFISPLPLEKGNPDVRLTVDYEEDIDFYRQLYNRVNYLDPSSQIIKEALKSKLNKINWFRNQEFLDNQRSFNASVRIETP